MERLDQRDDSLLRRRGNTIKWNNLLNVPCFLLLPLLLCAGGLWHKTLNKELIFFFFIHLLQVPQLSWLHFVSFFFQHALYVFSHLLPHVSQMCWVKNRLDYTSKWGSECERQSGIPNRRKSHDSLLFIGDISLCIPRTPQHTAQRFVWLWTWTLEGIKQQSNCTHIKLKPFYFHFILFYFLLCFRIVIYLIFLLYFYNHYI